jgi:hypothetical protein
LNIRAIAWLFQGAFGRERLDRRMNEISDKSAPAMPDAVEEAAARLDIALERIAGHLAEAARIPSRTAEPSAVPPELASRLDSLIERLRIGIGQT